MCAEFRGIFPPVTTPFDEAGAIRFESLAENLERYLTKPVGGFLILGSNGESVHLTAGEKLEIVNLFSEKTPRDKRLIVGLSSPSLQGGLEFLESTGHHRIDAYLVSVPSYFKNRMTEEAVRRYFFEVADRSSHPVLVYNVPQYSGIRMSPEFVASLAEHSNIAGMKDSSGDLNWLQGVLSRVEGESFQAILGSAQVLGPALSLGIQAAIVAIGCALPELPSQVMSEFRSGLDHRESQRQLHQISVALTARFGVAGVKHAMDRFGFCGGACRLPLLPLEPSESAEIDALLDASKLAERVSQEVHGVRVGE